MFARVIIAGVLGGLVVFTGGFITHMVFDWSGRTLSVLKNESEVRQFISQQKIEPGVYMFPSMPKDTPKEQYNAEYDRLNEEYKKGPAGFLVVPPTGQDAMGPMTLGMECVTNIIAAYLAAWIVSLIAPTGGFFVRWLAVFAMGVFAWFSLSASYGIWYRFPWDFIRDEFFCSAFEWALAGIVIAAIVRKKVVTTSQQQM